MSTAEQLRHELRFGSDDVLQRRRTAAGLALLTLSSMGVMTLYQLGVIKHLPEPPLPGLDAEKVNGSAEAYGCFLSPMLCWAWVATQPPSGSRQWAERIAHTADPGFHSPWPGRPG